MQEAATTAVAERRDADCGDAGAALVLIPGADPDASFVAADRSLLAGLARLVEVVPARDGSGRAGFVRALRQAVRTPGVRLAVLWFATPGYGGLTTWVCRQHRIPLIVIAGGADVASVPSAGFGAARVVWTRAIVRWILNSAAAVWAFSDAAAVEVRAVAHPSRLLTVPPAVDTAFYVPDSSHRERLVLTTCATLTRTTIRQKGLERLRDIARVLGDVRFVLTGHMRPGDRHVASFVTSLPANVDLRGFVPPAELRQLYARAKVYVQLSVHEGFGVAVAQALAMGCTPVVSDLPALRELVGNRGHYVDARTSAESVARVVKRAIEEPARGGRWADIDRRFGWHVRRAAWRAELDHQGFRARTEV